jgi:hypothetical protein
VACDCRVVLLEAVPREITQPRFLTASESECVVWGSSAVRRGPSRFRAGVHHRR